MEHRKKGKPIVASPGIFSTNLLSRLYTVHPKQRECFYLRLLLINMRVPISYEYLRTLDIHINLGFEAWFTPSTA